MSLADDLVNSPESYSGEVIDDFVYVVSFAAQAGGRLLDDCVAALRR